MIDIYYEIKAQHFALFVILCLIFKGFTQNAFQIVV